jgi:hypothetical protein
MSTPEDPAVAGTDKAFQESDSSLGATSSEQTSDDDREGVEATDTEARSPHGVGESTRRSGEDIAQDEEGPTTEGTKGASDRPYGKAEPSGSTGVDQQETVTEGPDLPPA